MDWLHPTFAGALLAVPLVGYLFWRAAQRRRLALDRFGGPAMVRRLAPTLRSWRRRLKATVVVAAVLGLALSLMGPRLGTEVRTVERKGVDLVIALDVSASMRAQDVAPNRLARAKAGIRDLLDQLGGDRVGLVLFSGSGFVQCPLTTDYGAIRLFLDAATAGQVPVPGTNLASAVDASTEAFASVRSRSDSATGSNETRSKVLLLLSDGEHHEGNLSTVREEAKANDIRLFTSGVGTTEGTQIPVYENGKQVGVKRDREGQPVRTRLDEAALRRLAGDGGAYFRIGRTSSALSEVPTALRQLDRATFTEKQFAEYAEMYQWPLAVALVLLLFDVLFPVRSRGQRTRKIV